MIKKVKLVNSGDAWDADRRYKINSIATHNGLDWQNTTGKNSEPGVGNDWVFLNENNFLSFKAIINSGSIEVLKDNLGLINAVFSTGQITLYFPQDFTVHKVFLKPVAVEASIGYVVSPYLVTTALGADYVIIQTFNGVTNIDVFDRLFVEFELFLQ